MKHNLVIRKHADTSEGIRIPKWDPNTGERRLVNPASLGDEHEPWPLLGIEIIGGAPAECRIPMSTIQQGMTEGWISVEGERAVVRPAGPVESPLSLWHTFLHCDSLTIHTVEGDAPYAVTHLPDKYAAEGDDATSVTGEMYAAGETRVDFFFELQLQE